MDYFPENKIFELNPSLGLPGTIYPRFPPGIRLPTIGVIDQNRLKEKFFKERTSMNLKLQDFNQMYQKFATGLFEAAYPQMPPGHPLFSNQETTAGLKSENEKLRKENFELKKQLDKSQKTK